MKAIKASEFNPDDPGFIFHMSPLEAVIFKCLVGSIPGMIVGKIHLEVHHMWNVMNEEGIPNPEMFMSISTNKPSFNLKEWVNENY